MKLFAISSSFVLVLGSQLLSTANAFALDGMYTMLFRTLLPSVLSGTCDDIKEFMFNPVDQLEVCTCNAKLDTFWLFWIGAVEVDLECDYGRATDRVIPDGACKINGNGRANVWDVFLRRTMRLELTTDCMGDIFRTTDAMQSFTRQDVVQVGISGNERFPEFLNCGISMDMVGAPPKDCGCSVCSQEPGNAFPIAALPRLSYDCGTEQTTRSCDV